MGRITGIFAALAVVVLAGCNTDLERGAAGAAIGAGTAVVLDGDVATGAIIGGAAGVLCDDAGAC